MESIFGKVQSNYYTTANAAKDIFNLTFNLLKNITRQAGGRKSFLIYKDIIDIRICKLSGYKKEEPVKP